MRDFGGLFITDELGRNGFLWCMKTMCVAETEEPEHPSQVKFFSLASALKSFFKDRKPVSRDPLTLDDILEVPKFKKNKGKRLSKKQTPTLTYIMSGKDHQNALTIRNSKTDKKRESTTEEANREKGQVNEEERDNGRKTVGEKDGER